MALRIFKKSSFISILPITTNMERLYIVDESFSHVSGVYKPYYHFRQRTVLPSLSTTLSTCTDKSAPPTTRQV